MPGPTSVIDDVSDTALWVATYRARETQRPDALFKDPLAARLAGDRGSEIASKMMGSRYTEWTVVIRTYMIDRYIQELVAEQGVDLVLNLGAGLDTRPYRLEVPSGLRWIEVDFPKIIDLKEERLKGEAPRCRLERVRLDLADVEKRRRFFAEVASGASKVLVLTEGVVPYLDLDEAGALAEDLRAQPRFAFWIVDYFSKIVEPYLRNPKRLKQMSNAPFKFFPDDWFGFFAQRGWGVRETRYHPEVARKLGRPMPVPWLVRLAMAFASKSKREPYEKVTGYFLLEPLKQLL